MTRVPDANVRAELEQALSEDRTRLGDVFRLSEQGLRADQIADRLGVRTSGFVSNYRTCVRAILDGIIPRGRTMRPQVAGQVRRLMRSPELSVAAADYLRALLRSLEGIGGSETAATYRQRSEQPIGREAKPVASREQPRRGAVLGRQTTWRRLVESELQRLYSPGQRFGLSDFMDKAAPAFQAEFPGNRDIGASVRQIMQRLRDDGVLEFLHRGEYRYLGRVAEPSGADHNPDVARLLEGLVEKIADETSIDADDYLDMAASEVPTVLVQRLLASGRTSPTFKELNSARRLDLTIEQLVVNHPYLFDAEMRAEAQGRLDYYQTD